MLYRFISLGVVLAASGLLQASVLPSLAQEQASPQIAQSADDRVGQINPNAPIRIDIANAGDLDIVFSLSQPVSASRVAPAGGEISFGTTHTSFLPPPVYLLAYPEETEIAVNFYVLSTANNIIEIVIGEQLSDVPSGRTLTIEPDGSVYIF